MGNVILKGHISYAAKRKYRWIAEFGKNTCEKCAALDGKEFEEDEIPPRPHPNCRCKVEEISIVDEIESELNEYREEIEQLKLQADELLGDTSVLREQIEKLMKENNTPEVRTLDNRLAGIEYDVYKLIDKIEALNIDTISASVIQRIEKEVEKIKNSISEYSKEYKGLDRNLKAEKFVVDGLVAFTSFSARDAAALWVLASSKFKRGLEYINKNGKMVNKVSDLKNENLQKEVRNKLHSQIQKQESRGIHLYSNSSLSKSLSNSLKFKSIINANKERLRNGETIPKISAFLGWNWNNFLSINGCDILNVHVKNGILYATVLDTVDYNPNQWWVKYPRDLQEVGAIENYYVVIDIAEPISKYLNL